MASVSRSGFQATIENARFVDSPYTATQMHGLAQALGIRELCAGLMAKDVSQIGFASRAARQENAIKIQFAGPKSAA